MTSRYVFRDVAPQQNMSSKRHSSREREPASKRPKVVYEYKKCKHPMCIALFSSNHKTQIGVSVVVRTNDYIIAGKVGLGSKYGKNTTCCGSFDHIKDKCCMGTAIRELNEEFKIEATIDKFECVVLINNAVVMLYNCVGCNFDAMQKRVVDDHKIACTIMKLQDDDACKNVVWKKDEPPDVSHAAAEGEMQTLVKFPYTGVECTMKDVMPYIAVHVTEILKAFINNCCNGKIIWKMVKSSGKSDT
jgi:hypothetical protein